MSIYATTIGTILKLRGQEDIHTWSEKCWFLSTLRLKKFHNRSFPGHISHISWGPFTNYVDKRTYIHGQKNVNFCPHTYIHCQKLTIFCPRSLWTTPYVCQKGKNKTQHRAIVLSRSFLWCWKTLLGVVDITLPNPPAQSGSARPGL